MSDLNKTITLEVDKFQFDQGHITTEMTVKKMLELIARKLNLNTGFLKLTSIGNSIARLEGEYICVYNLNSFSNGLGDDWILVDRTRKLSPDEIKLYQSFQTIIDTLSIDSKTEKLI